MRSILFPVRIFYGLHLKDYCFETFCYFLGVGSNDMILGITSTVFGEANEGTVQTVTTFVYHKFYSTQMVE